MTDNDLNMVEAWGLGSSQVVASDDTKTEQTVLDLFQSDRKRALTPRNILLGKHSVQDENAIRTKGSYDGGLLTFFGPQFMWGYDHKIIFEPLNEDGTATAMSIEVSKDGTVVPPQDLTLIPQLIPFYEQPTINGNSVVLKFK
jgi:hypothetical protein